MEINVGIAEKLLKQISASWPHPVGIINTDGYILSHTSVHLRDQFCPPAWDLLQRGLPEILVPFAANSEAALPGAYLPIAVNQRTVGVLLVHYSTQEDILTYAHLLQKLCCQCLENFISGNFFNLKNYERTSFCVEWLEGRYEGDVRAFSEKAALSNIDISADGICVVLHVLQAQLDQSLRFSIAEMLNHLEYLYVLRESDFVLIFHQKAFKTISREVQELQEAVSSLVPRHLIAVGRPYDCMHLSNSYQEALKLVHYYGNTVTGILYYRDELLNIYLYDAPTPVKKQFISQVFADYSPQEISQIYEFILTYIECNGSLQAISQKLFIHKNTIQYRIEQLHKRTGYDLRKIEDCQKLAIACKWMRF